VHRLGPLSGHMEVPCRTAVTSFGVLPSTVTYLPGGVEGSEFPPQHAFSPRQES
jgi:hypothetical protein